MQVSGLGWCPSFGFTLRLLGWKSLLSELQRVDMAALPQQPCSYHRWKSTAFLLHWVLWKIQQCRQMLWPYRHWWEPQRGFWITSLDAALNPQWWISDPLALLSLPVGVYQPWPGSASVFLCTRLFSREWQGAGKQHLFVSFSDNGKYISLHPFLGIAWRQKKNSFSLPWRRTGAGNAQHGGWPEAGHLGATAASHRGDSYPCTLPHPCGWCQTPPALELFGFNLHLVHWRHLVLHWLSQAAQYLGQGFLSTHFFYYIMDLGFFPLL